MKLLKGDCFDVMQGLPDNSVDLVLTDPPYGLSNGDTKGIADRIGSAFIDVVLPDLYDFNSKSGRLGKFAGPLDSVSFLDFMNRAFREEPRIAMPESAVDLQRSPIAEQEVKNKSESTIDCADGKLRGVVNSDGVQFCRDYAFYPRACFDPSVCDSKRIGLRQLGPGRFGMPVVISLDSELARFLCSLTPSGPSFLADLIGLCDNAQTLSCAPSGIMASTRAEIGVMLSFDSSNGTVEFLPASGTLQGDIVLDVFAAKNVGAGAGACCLSPKFKPRTFGVIGDTADRAITFYFHDSILSEMEKTRKGFMGKTWDGNVPDTAIWAECLRVLKPGGHLLAFAGTRTQHRMACRIEDAGFEIRDMLAWLYGSGFPKSLDVSKAIDKAAGAEREVVGLRVYGDGHVQRSSIDKLTPPIGTFVRTQDDRVQTSPATDAAREWAGWGTALKPAIEPITMARKPLVGTVAANVLEYGTGGLNIDACRVGTGQDKGVWPVTDRAKKTQVLNDGLAEHVVTDLATGRWPANLIHDGSEEAVEPLGSAARFFMTLPFENECALCYNTCSKASNNDTENETWKIILARNAEKSGWTSQAISEFIVRVNVIGQANVSLAQNARSAGSLCDSCAMSIAVALAGIKTSAFRSEELGVILASIGSSKSSILLQNLVSFAELWGNIDTIPTTKSLSLLFGSVRDAIASSTKKASEEEAAGGNGQEKETLCRLKYCAKASKRERDAGLDGMRELSAGERTNRKDGSAGINAYAGATGRAKNPHPTVKPIALMEYLVKLASTEGAVVLDPFMGSGTTGIACRNLGREFIGIEMDEAYFEIAQRRIGVQTAEDLF